MISWGCGCGCLLIKRKPTPLPIAADWNSISHRLTTERLFYIRISGNNGVEIKHFDAESNRERHWINLKVSEMSLRVIIFIPNRKLQNHFFWNRTRVRRWRCLEHDSRFFTAKRSRYNKQNGRENWFSYINIFSISIVIYFSLYMPYLLLFSRKKKRKPFYQYHRRI
jgi:hypothetical protein